jgi:hypothetical protein
MTGHSRLARRALAGLTGLLAACLVSAGLAGCGGTSATSGPPGFNATGSMTAARMSHTATLLPNGKILVAGGYSGGGPDHLTYLAAAELYDPASGTFSATGSMTTARAGATAILLPTGRVLIAGGYTIDGSGATIALASAELYDPASGTFTATGSMASARYHYAATLLGGGRALFAGGAGAGRTTLASAEVYDPATGTFGSAGSMTTGRIGQTATLLEDGRVLLVGGVRDESVYLDSAELYDPASGTFTATGSMAAARYDPCATKLPDGRVLVAGGLVVGGDGMKVSLASAEIFDPATGAFTSTGSMAAARSAHGAVLLSSGRVLVVGGLAVHSGADLYATTAELYDPAGGAFSAAGSTTGRVSATVTLLADGRALIAGGGNASSVLASAELYQP